MTTTPGLRDRKKAQKRERIADVAAGLFADRGWDAVLVVEIARAADVSEQTVYNYFPAKQDLVLDRADEITERYRRVVVDKEAGSSPAGALRPLLVEDVERFATEDPALARGEFPAQCVVSPVLRRFALELRERQADAIAASLAITDPDVPALSARAHAAALLSVVQSVTDRVGRAVLDGAVPGSRASATAARGMRRDADAALDDLDRAFALLTSGARS